MFCLQLLNSTQGPVTPGAFEERMRNGALRADLSGTHLRDGHGTSQEAVLTLGPSRLSVNT